MAQKLRYNDPVRLHQLRLHCDCSSRPRLLLLSNGATVAAPGWSDLPYLLLIGILRDLELHEAFLSAAVYRWWRTAVWAEPSPFCFIPDHDSFFIGHGVRLFTVSSSTPQPRFNFFKRDLQVSEIEAQRYFSLLVQPLPAMFCYNLTDP